MTPAELRAYIDGKVKIQKVHRDAMLQHFDRMQAAQTARLMNMINLRGKEMILKEDIEPEDCMTFDWKRSPEEAENPDDKMRKIERYVQARIAAAGRVKSHG